MLGSAWKELHDSGCKPRSMLTGPAAGQAAHSRLLSGLRGTQSRPGPRVLGGEKGRGGTARPGAGLGQAPLWGEAGGLQSQQEPMVGSRGPGRPAEGRAGGGALGPGGPVLRAGDAVVSRAPGTGKVAFRCRGAEMEGKPGFQADPPRSQILVPKPLAASAVMSDSHSLGSPKCFSFPRGSDGPGTTICHQKF